MVLDILKFIFSDIWHYLGTLILIYVLGVSISAIAQSFRSVYQPITYNFKGEKMPEDIKNENRKES